MAESVTYADLRFVKAPLKKRISSHLDSVDDGELTYENVQVPSISGGASSLASSGPGDKAGLQPQPPAASWSSVTSPAASRLLACRSVCGKYLLGLLLTCLLLGMTAISLGVRYLQVSQQLRHTQSILEAANSDLRQQLQRTKGDLEVTNSSLRQQLHLKITQLGQREQDLQGFRRELAQSQEALQVEQKDCQAVKEQLQDCQFNREETKKSLQSEEEQRRELESKLTNIWDTLKTYCRSSSQETCCPKGWTLIEGKCLSFLNIKKNWEESKNYCKNLSSSLITVTQHSYSDYYPDDLFKLSKQIDWFASYWIEVRSKDGQQNYGKIGLGYHDKNRQCPSIRNRYISYQRCTYPLLFICEKEAVKYPDQH